MRLRSSLSSCLCVFPGFVTEDSLDFANSWAMKGADQSCQRVSNPNLSCNNSKDTSLVRKNQRYGLMTLLVFDFELPPRVWVCCDASNCRLHNIKRVCCRSCPAAVCSRPPLCSCTVRTWCLQRRSWNSVRRRRVTATRRMPKTVTAPSCWSTPAPATHTGYFSTDGWRRASAVRSA